MDDSQTNASPQGKVMWYKGVFEESIFRDGQAPSKDEVNELVERYYMPYYNAMMAIIASLTDRRKSNKERILVIDGHSFPLGGVMKNVWNKYGVKNESQLPMLIVGDSEGMSCDADIQKAFISIIEKNFSLLSKDDQQLLLKKIKGGVVGLNYPFKGVQNVKFYGQREEGVNALQVECSDAAYIDEKNGNYYDYQYNESKLKLIHDLIEKSCRDIDPILKNK